MTLRRFVALRGRLRDEVAVYFRSETKQQQHAEPAATEMGLGGRHDR